MKKFFAAMSAALLALTFVAATAFAANPGTGKNAITCFGTTNGCVVLNKTTARITTEPEGEGGGVYIINANSSFYGVRLSALTSLSNTYTTVSGDTANIDPRWSIPIDENNDGYTEAFAFVSFSTCNDGAGLVDVLNDSTCLIDYEGVTYPNWLTFATTGDGTNYEVSAIDNYAFIVADGSGTPGTWTVSNVKIGKPGK